jgi:hypothetical protein
MLKLSVIAQCATILTSLVAFILATLALYQSWKRTNFKYEDIFSEEVVRYLIAMDKKLNIVWLDLFYLQPWIQGVFKDGGSLNQLKEDEENWLKYVRYKEVCIELAHFWATVDHYYWQRLSGESKDELNKISEEIRIYQPYTPSKISELDREQLQKHMNVFLRARGLISSFALSQAKLF